MAQFLKQAFCFKTAGSILTKVLPTSCFAVKALSLSHKQADG